MSLLKRAIAATTAFVVFLLASLTASPAAATPQPDPPGLDVACAISGNSVVCTGPGVNISLPLPVETVIEYVDRIVRVPVPGPTETVTVRPEPERVEVPVPGPTRTVTSSPEPAEVGPTETVTIRPEPETVTETETVRETITASPSAAPTPTGQAEPEGDTIGPVPEDVDVETRTETIVKRIGQGLAVTLGLGILGAIMFFVGYALGNKDGQNVEEKRNRKWLRDLLDKRI